MDNKAEHSTSHSLATQVVKVFSAIEASQEAVFVTDTKGRIEYANQKFLDLNGWSEHEALGRSVSEIPHSKNIALKLLESLKQGRSWSMRHQVTSTHTSDEKDSNLIWVRTSIDPIIEIPEEISGYIGIQSVINQEVERELQSKKELSKVLALAIKQEKALEELKRSHDEALQQVANKAAFLANMSHEIRTPLNGVLGMAELLQNTHLSNKQSHLTDIIQQSGKTLLNLINDILDLSKIEAGKLELNNSSHDLRLIMEEVASAFSERASSKGLELTCIYPANDHSLYVCDKQRLVQILSNLISNAIKFTDNGEIVIRVDINKEEYGNSVYFEVNDTGVGIPEKDKNAIFDSFSQSQQTVEHTTEGTGLGLTICQHLVNLMDGEIGVMSTVGEGSTFWFTAQLEKDSGHHVDKDNKEQVLSDLKVLIVDDNDSNSRNIAQQLKEWDIEAVTVSSAESAVEILESSQHTDKPFSLAILDHDMPDISGLKLAKIVKNNESFAEMPLILMNSINHLEETMVWTSAGIKSYLTKPVRQADLYNALLATVSLPERKVSDSETENVSDPVMKVFNAHILVAEDNPVNQELAELMLKEHGCTVEIASNGKKAIMALKESKNKPFDLILMDCQMPEMDGYETTRIIRLKLVDEDRIPIIALTANAMEGDRQRCLNAGMDDYLTKPFTREQLTSVLEKWLPEDNLEDNKVVDKGSSDQSEPDDLFSLTAPETDQTVDNIEVAETINTIEEESVETELPGQLNQTTLDNIRSLQREGAPDILGKIVGLYFENSNKILTELERAVKSKDAKIIRSTAHSLKSSSANLGADNLAELCKEIENLGKNNQLDEIDRFYDQLKQQYDTTCDALRQEIS